MRSLPLVGSMLCVAVSLAAQEAARPSHRLMSAIAVDVAGGRLVLFGGVGPEMQEPFEDTWEWDGRRWRQFSPDPTPGPRAGAAMAWDPVRGRAVLYGGLAAHAAAFHDTWAWDGRAWTRVGTAGAPGTRVWHTMYFDARRGQVLLVGGMGGAAGEVPMDDIWAWDGAAWTEVLPGTAFTGLAIGERTRRQAYRAALRSDLRNLATAQELYFADHFTYAPSLDSSAFVASGGVTVRIVSASPTGWSAEGTHAGVPGARCGIFVGDAPPPFAAVQEPGVPECEGFEP